MTRNSSGVCYWRHRGIWASWKEHLIDGVHFNKQGLKKHFNSIRAALVAAENHVAAKS